MEQSWKMGTDSSKSVSLGTVLAVVAALAVVVILSVWTRGVRRSSPESETGTEASARHEGVSDDLGSRVRAGGRRQPQAGKDAWAQAVRARRERSRLQGEGDRVRGSSALDSNSVDSRLRAARRAGTAEDLGEEDEDEIREMSRVALTDPDPDERAMALWSLAGIGDEVALPVLTKALSDPDKDVRLAALGEFSNFSDTNLALDPATQALLDSDSEVRIEALRLLADIEDERALDAVRTLLEDPDPDVKTEAEEIIEAAQP